MLQLGILQKVEAPTGLPKFFQQPATRGTAKNHPWVPLWVLAREMEYSCSYESWNIQLWQVSQMILVQTQVWDLTVFLILEQAEQDSAV